MRSVRRFIEITMANLVGYGFNDVDSSFASVEHVHP